MKTGNLDQIRFKRKEIMMIKYRILKKTVCSWGFCIFLIVLAYTLMVAGPAVAKDGSTPVPKKGLEKGIQQTQEPAAPQPQCPKGMVWSAKDEKCVSKLKPVTQGEGGGGGGSVSKTPHSEFTSPGDRSNQ